MFERKVCTECGRELPLHEFYDKYARCKQCTREDQNAANWYKPVALLPYEQWPGALQAYVDSRREYVSQGRSVPALTKEMLLAYSLSQDECPDAPTEVSLPVIVSLHRQLKLLNERVDALTQTLEQLQAKPSIDHDRRTLSGELKNLYRAVCKEVNETLDQADAADVKAGVYALNRAVLAEAPMPANAVLDVVLTLAQLQLTLPAPLEDLYHKYYAPQLPSAAEADVQRVIDIAGVNLYEVDWVEFLQGA